MKTDNARSTIDSMRGGNVVKLEADSAIGKPAGLSQRLWQQLHTSYNQSQLLAIKYVSEAFEGTQDTRIALIQGPPGTGKTSTVLGMVAALLHQPQTESKKSDEDKDKENNGKGGPHLSDPAEAPVVKMPARAPQRVSTTSAADAVAATAHKRLLICAPSNAAIDELLKRLAAGVLNTNGQIQQRKIVRLGDPLDGADKLALSLSLDSQVQAKLAEEPGRC